MDVCPLDAARLRRLDRTAACRARRSLSDHAADGLSTIPKSGRRFSEEIMLEKESRT
jgi:hypothetical protein